MNHHKVIGILGGMGPEASSTCYRKIIQYSQKAYGAVQDNEYPPVLLNSITPSGFDETGIADEEELKKYLFKGLQDLERGGADIIIIPCNTVHIFYKEMQQAIHIPIFNIVDETVKHIQKQELKKIGIFSSESTNRTGLYVSALREMDVTSVTASVAQQQVLNRVIEHVMGGHQGVNDVLELKEIMRNFLKQDADAIVLACTELPLAFNQSHTDVQLFDSIEILVQAAVDYSLK